MSKGLIVVIVIAALAYWAYTQGYIGSKNGAAANTPTLSEAEKKKQTELAAIIAKGYTEEEAELIWKSERYQKGERNWY